MGAPFPFPYFGHGNTWPRKGLDIHLWFCQEVSGLESLPGLLRTNFTSDGPHAHCWSNDFLTYALAASHDSTSNVEVIKGPEDTRWQDFQQAVDAAVIAIHTRSPLRFVVKFGRRDTRDQWHVWSVASAHNVVVPLLERFIAERPWLSGPAGQLESERRHRRVGVSSLVARISDDLSSDNAPAISALVHLYAKIAFGFARSKTYDAEVAADALNDMLSRLSEADRALAEEELPTSVVASLRLYRENHAVRLRHRQGRSR